MRSRLPVARRDAWFRSYLTTILQRDVRDLANIEGLSDLPRLLTLLATRSSSLLNTAELGRSMGIAHTSLRRYLALLEATFLTQRLPAWSGDVGRRLVRSPKVLLLDAGLAAHLVGASKRRMAADPQLAGPLFESFVAMELRKQASWSRTEPQLLHYRAHTGQEVDIVLEDRAGRIVGIEVKAGATLSGSSFRGLRALQEATGDRFVRGIVLYTGAECVPFGRRIQALPVAALWRLG